MVVVNGTLDGPLVRAPLVALIACALLAAAPTASVATPPGKNGQIAFRRYLDPRRSTGALFRANPDGSGVVQVTRPPRGVVDQYRGLGARRAEARVRAQGPLPCRRAEGRPGQHV